MALSQKEMMKMQRMKRRKKKKRWRKKKTETNEEVRKGGCLEALVLYPGKQFARS